MSRKIQKHGNSSGDALKNLGRFDDALDRYEKALEVDPQNTSALIGRGDVLNNLGRFGDELLCYEKVLEIDPKECFCLEQAPVSRFASPADMRMH